jgi:hypothetical protein
MSVENPLRGAPRIHGELLKLGFEAAQSSVAKYMVKRRGATQPGITLAAFSVTQKDEPITFLPANRLCLRC